MTKDRRDGNDTPFGDWLRNQKKLSSEHQYEATDIDYFWHNWGNGKRMMLEEKTNRNFPRKGQMDMFIEMDMKWCGTPGYYGFHILCFEHNSPKDGRIWLDGKLITEKQLVDFLQFKGISEKKVHDPWFTAEPDWFGQR